MLLDSEDDSRPHTEKERQRNRDAERQTDRQRGRGNGTVSWPQLGCSERFLAQGPGSSPPEALLGSSFPPPYPIPLHSQPHWGSLGRQAKAQMGSRPQSAVPQLMPLDSAFIRKEPLGPGLIIAPWNYPRTYPWYCALEVSESTEKVLAEVLPRYLAQLLCRGAGRAEETGQLLEHKFDYILFTRGPRVGKVVMAAAAEHLTPVTLELGGKNPCYVDDNCDPQTVANRVAFFRYFNAGQTCVAPDYILCSPEMQARLLPALQSAITRFYGEDPQSSPDLGRIISEKNFQRLRRLLSCGRVAIGGQSDESDRYIAPTVLVGVQETEPVMREEIFGPILPIMNVRSLDEPLALYAFSNSSQVGLDRGGSNRGAQKGETGHLPFPGPLVRVNNSGMGSYHSKFSSDAFSHHRACLLSPSGLEKLKDIRYSPFSACKQQLLSWALGNQRCILL
uniref:Aldehyde dehydrogenase 3 family member B2 n=1 Tax=Phocoena sinus TaxID=42100 RepID=A0A8C9C6G6_PHOSS